MEKKFFGNTPQGEAFLYTLENKNGMKAEVSNFGAILVNLFVPDKSGNLADVVLGYDDATGYLNGGSFLGATVGPSANRVKDAKFVIDGETFQLDVNDGKNNLHSHLQEAFHKKIWDVLEGDNRVTFMTSNEDGVMGFPGNMKISVSYTLTEKNELIIHYQGISDKNTLINMTNHSYFNLAGHNSGLIHDHVLWMKASHYTPVVAGAIPTGEIAPVAGTPMDFTTPTVIGTRIAEDFEQLNLVGGYDHNWVIDQADGNIQLIASVEDKTSGRIMETYTDLPGVQFYAGNFIGKEIGKAGAAYGPRTGLCLETQYYPNSINQEGFPKPEFGPERPYDTTTIYKFI